MPRLVVVEGEAGIGKTRLVSDFVAEATERGGTVLRGSCVDLGDSPIAHLPLRAALADLIDSVGDERVLGLAGSGIVALAPLLPELAKQASPGVRSGRADASQLFDVVAPTRRPPVSPGHGSARCRGSALGGRVDPRPARVPRSRAADQPDHGGGDSPDRPPPPEHTTEFLDELNRLPMVDRMRLARLDRADVARQLRGILGRSVPAATLSHVARLSQAAPSLSRSSRAPIRKTRRMSLTVHETWFWCVSVLWRRERATC